MLEGLRYVGDKSTQVVYDLDDADPRIEARVRDLVAGERFAVFSPDSLSEARNRGYRSPRRRWWTTAR